MSGKPLDQFAGQMESEAAQHVRQKHPSGWEPHVEEFGDTATGITEPMDNPSPKEAELIKGWNLVPEEWRIVGKVNCRRWQGYDGRWLYYYKADLVRIDPLVHKDVDALYKRIQNFKCTPKPGAVDGATFLLLIGDTQIGKGDGDGSIGTIDRWQHSLEGQIARFKELSKKHRISSLATAFMGDLAESCVGNYPSQQFTTDLTMREQDGVLQELTHDTLSRLAPLVDDEYVLVVPGNHGEQRKDGKAYTLPSDNRDIAVVETVHRGIVLNKNHAFDHVRFVYPEGEQLTVCIDLSGMPTGFAHGHQFARGAGPAAKAESWWKDMSHNLVPIGDARLLFSGHYHHLLVTQNGRKTHVQIPALDGGSQWWENIKGQVSPPGMVSCLVGEGVGPHGCGIDDLKVI